MSELVLQGPFLTRAEAARSSGLPAGLLPDRPDLLHIRSRFAQEAYFAFQFDDHGIRPDVARVVRVMREHADEMTVADWLVRPNPSLAGLSPLSFLDRRGSIERVLLLDVEPDSEVADAATLQAVPPAGRSPSRQGVTAPQDDLLSQPDVLDWGRDDKPRRVRRTFVRPAAVNH